MLAGMQGSGTAASSAFFPSAPGVHRVGALGPQVGQLDPKILKQLLPMLFERQAENRTAQRINMLPPEQRQDAWMQTYFPKLWESGQRRAAELDQRAYDRRMELEQRGYDASVDEREFNQAQTKLNEARDWERKENERLAGGIRADMKPIAQVDPKFAEKAQALGITAPGGGDWSKVNYLPTANHLKRLEQYTGRPEPGVVTDEDVAKMNEMYQEFEQGRAFFGGQQFVPRNPAMPPNPMDPMSLSPGQVIESTPERRKKFEELVKIYRDPGKAFDKMLEHEKQADTIKRTNEATSRQTKRQTETAEWGKELKRRASLEKVHAAEAEAASYQDKFKPAAKPIMGKSAAGTQKQIGTDDSNVKEWEQKRAEAQERARLAREEYDRDWKSAVPKEGAVPAWVYDEQAPMEDPAALAKPVSAFGWRTDSNPDTMKAAAAALAEKVRAGQASPEEALELDALVRHLRGGAASPPAPSGMPASAAPVLAPTDPRARRIRELVAKNQGEGLTDEEFAELQQLSRQGG